MYFLRQLDPSTYMITRRMYARHYHLLREYMFEHREVAEILQAID